MRTAHLLVSPLAALTLVGPVGAQGFPAFQYGPDGWPALLRVAAQVPEFAGFSTSEGRGTLPALTDVAQERRLRAVLARDPYWRLFMLNRRVPTPGSLRLPDPVSALVKVARAVKGVRPTATVRVDTALNRVVMDADVKDVHALARQIGAGNQLIAAYGEPTPELRYDVQPRVVHRSQLRSLGSPLGPRVVPDLKVLVTNPTRRPTAFGVSCGGRLPVQVAYSDGRPVREEVGIGCTQEGGAVLIQPGQTLTFPSFQWKKLTHLKPGKYLWVYGNQTFPFTLKP